MKPIVIAYHPRKDPAARALSGEYVAQHGQKVPKGTRWLARSSRGSITAHQRKADAEAAIAQMDLDVRPDAQPKERESDLTPPKAPRIPIIEWTVSVPELRAGIICFSRAGDTRRLEQAAGAVAEKRKLRGWALVDQKQLDKRSAALLIYHFHSNPPDAEAFAREILDEYGGADSARKSYSEAHWGRESAEVSEVSVSLPKGALVALGALTEITYRTRKGRGPLTDYVHTFGETGRELPTLAYDEVFSLFIVGGGYTVTKRGIEG